MKLYEYELLENRIKIEEYEVRETEKSYIIEKNPHNPPYVHYHALNRIPKEIVDSGVQTSYSDMYFYSLSDDIEQARAVFAKHLEEVKIPSYEKGINEAKKKLDKIKAILNALIMNADAKRCGIKITYSNGDEEDGLYGVFTTEEEAYKEMCMMAAKEAYVQNEEFLFENTCSILFNAADKTIDLHYDNDDVWCYYRILER